MGACDSSQVMGAVGPTRWDWLRVIHMPRRRRPATIHRLRTKPERLRQEQGDHLRQLVLEFDLPEKPVAEIVAAIDRQTAESFRWTFIMLSSSQNAAVVGWLADNSRRPIKALMLWARLFELMRHDTGEIVTSRTQIAEHVGITPRHVSEIMSELASINAIYRWRDGCGFRNFMNANVATCLTGQSRDQAQAAQGALHIVRD